MKQPPEDARTNRNNASDYDSLCSALLPERILFLPDDASTHDIMRLLVDSLGLPDPAEILNTIEAREESGGILIWPNFAIPHAILAGIDRIIASLGIQHRKTNEKDDALFVLLFVSGAQRIKEHLAFLKSVASTITDEVIQQLSEAENPERAYAILCARS